MWAKGVDDEKRVWGIGGNRAERVVGAISMDCVWDGSGSDGVLCGDHCRHNEASMDWGWTVNASHTPGPWVKCGNKVMHGPGAFRGKNNLALRPSIK